VFVLLEVILMSGSISFLIFCLLHFQLHQHLTQGKNAFSMMIVSFAILASYQMSGPRNKTENFGGCEGVAQFF
jgi:hypothetical protein